MAGAERCLQSVAAIGSECRGPQADKVSSVLFTPY